MKKATREEDRRQRRLQRLAAQNTETSGNSENTSRNQTSLEMGSRTYKEYVHDAQMSAVDAINMDKADMKSIQKDYVRDKYNKDKAQESEIKERRYNAKVKEEMRNRNRQNQKLHRDRLNQRKAYNHIKKEDMEDEVMQDLLDEAAETETKRDDNNIKRRMPKTLETIKYDDGITEDDYIRATSKAARKYM